MSCGHALINTCDQAAQPVHYIETLWERGLMVCFLQVLASDEGRELRARQQENVRYIREKLVAAGIPAMHSPSHIIPIHVRTPG